MNAWDLIGNEETEQNTKILLLYVMLCSTEHKEINLDVEHLQMALGLSKGQIYRAQGQLKKNGIIKIKSRYCVDTGKKLHDTYEFNN